MPKAHCCVTTRHCLMVPGHRARAQVVFGAPKAACVSVGRPPGSVDTLFLCATNIPFLSANTIPVLSIFYLFIQVLFFYLRNTPVGKRGSDDSPVLVWINFSKIKLLNHLLGLFNRTVCALRKSYSIHCFFGRDEAWFLIMKLFTWLDVPIYFQFEGGGCIFIAS